MTKTFALLAALAATSAAAYAQTAPPTPQTAPTTERATPSPEERAQSQTERLAKALSLTPDQQVKVQQLMAAQRQQVQTAIQQAGGNRPAMGKAMRAGRAKFDAQLQAVLTPAQFTHYQQLMAQRRDQLRARGGQDPDAD